MMGGDPVSVRDVIPCFDANLLGIDLFELEAERFRGSRHEALLQEHKKRVARFQVMQRVREFEGHLSAVGAMWSARAAIADQAVAGDRRYDFSHAQLAIAMRSLDEAGAM